MTPARDRRPCAPLSGCRGTGDRPRPGMGPRPLRRWRDCSREESDHRGRHEPPRDTRRLRRERRSVRTREHRLPFGVDRPPRSSARHRSGEVDEESAGHGTPAFHGGPDEIAARPNGHRPPDGGACTATMGRTDPRAHRGEPEHSEAFRRRCPGAVAAERPHDPRVAARNGGCRGSGTDSIWASTPDAHGIWLPGPLRESPRAAASRPPPSDPLPGVGRAT
jgi:hypothetical protein